MKFAISILFLAATSRAAPSISDMNTGSVHNTLDRTQKATDIQITNKVIPDIQRNFDLIKQTNEREYKEISQIYEYIDASIAHATKSIMKAITDLKTNTDESIRALGENTRENLISLKTINNENNQKILEKTVDSSDSALALSLNWMSRRMDAAEVRERKIFFQQLLFKMFFSTGHPDEQSGCVRCFKRTKDGWCCHLRSNPPPHRGRQEDQARWQES